MNTRHICPCWHCKGPIRFAAERDREMIECPHCGQETELFVQDAIYKKTTGGSYWLYVFLGLAMLLIALAWAGAEGIGGAIAGTIGLLFIGFLYFLPTVIAVRRKHRNESALVIVNLFLGWTLVGWVVALAWAVYEDKPQTAK